MKTCIATLESISPYSCSRKHDMPKLEDGKESYADYESRTWRERCNVIDDGEIVIPPMAFKRSVETAARYLRMRIPGKNQSEYSKHFLSGVLVTTGLKVGVKKHEVLGEKLSLSANGKRGGGKRVDRIMPVIPKWTGEVEFFVLDDTITEEVFEKTLREAGNFIGVGRFRPENGGYYGRYKVNKFVWN
jgi:hypothetical protein